MCNTQDYSRKSEQRSRLWKTKCCGEDAQPGAAPAGSETGICFEFCTIRDVEDSAYFLFIAQAVETFEVGGSSSRCGGNLIGFNFYTLRKDTSCKSAVNSLCFCLLWPLSGTYMFIEYKEKRKLYLDRSY